MSRLACPTLDYPVKNPSESTIKKDHIPNVGFVSLGCPKALVDSEQIITQLRAEGYAISGTYDGADLVVVNTCGFIDEAVQESLDAIGEALAENGKVIVTGCLGAKKNAAGEDIITSVHPKVLAGVGYDPSVYTGFAFGMGVGGIAMLKYGIDDIRLFYANDLRFLRQF